MTILFIGLGLFAFVGFGLFCWLRRKEIMNESNFNEDLAKNYQSTAIVFWVLAAVFALLVCCLISRIKLAVKLIQSASDFITERKHVLISPIITYFFISFFTLVWIVCFSYVFSVGKVRYDKGDMFGDVDWPENHYYFIYLMIFGLLWMISFFMSSNIFNIAAMACSWYFHRHSGNMINLCTALCWGLTYHLGSLAFGSFIIALLWFV